MVHLVGTTASSLQNWVDLLLLLCFALLLLLLCFSFLGLLAVSTDELYSMSKGDLVSLAKSLHEIQKATATAARTQVGTILQPLDCHCYFYNRKCIRECIVHCACPFSFVWLWQASKDRAKIKEQDALLVAAPGSDDAAIHHAVEEEARLAKKVEGGRESV